MYKIPPGGRGSIASSMPIRAFVEMFLQHCDGVDIAFPFGKRDINLRNVNAQCCDTDLCNYPAPTLVPVTGMLQNIMGQQARF